MTPRLRLLKVIVQPVFVLDDGESLTEQPAQPVSVSADDWPTYATTRFLTEVQKLQAELDAAAGDGQAAQLHASAPGAEPAEPE